jgi:hypothetical protein
MNDVLTAFPLNTAATGEPVIPEFPLSELLNSVDTVDIEYERIETHVVNNETPGERKRSYLVQKLGIDTADYENPNDVFPIRGCSCKGFQYNQLPKPEEIESVPMYGLNNGVGACKHIKAVLKADRTSELTDDGQRGMDGFE